MKQIIQRIAICLLGWHILYLPLHAQKLGFLEALIGSKKSKVDSLYIQEFPSFLTPRIYGTNRIQRFDLFASNLPYDRIRFATNQTPDMGFGAWYKNVGLAISFQNPFAKSRYQNLPETVSLEILLNLYSRRFGVDLFLTQYTGYVIDNAPDVFKGSANIEQLRERPDMKTFTLGGNFNYFFNWRKFSYRAANISTERQLKSAGSWIALGGFYLQTISADRPFLENLPAVPQPPGIPNAYYATSVRQYNFSLGGGYTHSFVVRKKFFFNATALPAFVISTYQVPTVDGREVVRGQLNYRLTLRAALGYNGDRYFGGVNGVSDFYNLEFINKQYYVIYQQASIIVYVGRRFDMKGAFGKKQK